MMARSAHLNDIELVACHLGYWDLHHVQEGPAPHPPRLGLRGKPHEELIHRDHLSNKVRHELHNCGWA